MAKAAPAAPRKAPAKAKTPKAGTTKAAPAAKPTKASNWRVVAKTAEDVAKAVDASLAVKVANVQGAKASKKAAEVHIDAVQVTKSARKRGETPEIVKSEAKTTAKTPADPTTATRAHASDRKNKPHVTLDEPMIARILAEVAEGKSLHKVCRGDDMPDRVWVLAKFNSTPEMRQRWEAAMEARAHKHAEEIIEIADDGSNDTYVDADGMVKVDHDVVARSKLRIDARKWYASKLSPKYSDRVDVNHGVQPENPMAALLAQVAGTALSIKTGNDE
jgi:hypothetical protein